MLFVCTGNICRSPLAEGLLVALAAEAGLAHAVEVDSAATHDYEVGDPPDPRAIAAAKRRGIDISGQRARQVTRADFAEFDLIVALDRGHRDILRRMAPKGSKARIRLLMEFAPGESPKRQLDVPDPYYGEVEGFDPVCRDDRARRQWPARTSQERRRLVTRPLRRSERRGRE